MKLEEDESMSHSLSPLLEHGQSGRYRGRPTKKRPTSAYMLLLAAFLTGVVITRSASYLSTNTGIAKTVKMASEHVLGYNWDSFGQSWDGRSDSAGNDYVDRERWRTLMDVGPKLRVVPHGSLRRDGHGISPVTPADVCVMSSDSRAVDQNFNGDDHIALNAAATYSHMSWALRHGYQYRRLEGQDVWNTSRRPTWTKVPELLDTVKTCQWTVFFDSDMFMNEPSWSLDDMRLALGIHDEAVFYTGDDPGTYDNQHYPNTGFFIVQQSAISINALEHFRDCAEEFPECGRWRWDWPNEQGAFENFIAHRFLIAGENYIRGDCEMTNGYWEIKNGLPTPRFYCIGRITAHPWVWKGDVGNAVRRLMGLDFLRAALEIFYEEPDLRRDFANSSVLSLRDNERAMYVAEILAKAGAAPDLIGKTDVVVPVPEEKLDICVVNVDMHLIIGDIHKDDEGWALDLDGTTATSLIHMAYALRHGYQYRRVKEPPFAEHNVHAYWHAMRPLSHAVEACEWTIYYGQANYPLKMHENLDTLLKSWNVPKDADMIFAGHPDNHTFADTTFALIRRSPDSLRAMELLIDCPNREDCKSIFADRDPEKDVHDLENAFNQVVRPQLPADKVYVVPPCSGGARTGCNYQVYIEPNPTWFVKYTDWSRSVAKPIQELLGREALAYLSTVWQSFPLRTRPFAVTL